MSHASDTTFNDTDQFPNQHITAGEYSRELGVIHHLMPYPHYASNPWDDLSALQSWLRGQPETMATWMFRDLPDDVGPDNWQNRRSQTYALALGAWRMDINGGYPRYVHPNYQHRTELEWTPVGDRWDHIRQVARLGTVEKQALATRFNLTPRSLWNVCDRNGWQWRALQREGQRRLGNTIACTVAWTALTIPACARRLGMPVRTVRRCATEYADVEVPPDPDSHSRGDGWRGVGDY